MATLLLLIASITLISYGLLLRDRPRRLEKWPIETAQVEQFTYKVEKQPQVYVNIEFEVPDIEYSYRCGSKSYSGKRILVNESPRNLASWVSDAQQCDYEEGKCIEIRLRPGDPEYSLASTKLTSLEKQTAMSAIAGGLMCLSVAIWSML